VHRKPFVGRTRCWIFSTPQSPHLAGFGEETPGGQGMDMRRRERELKRGMICRGKKRDKEGKEHSSIQALL